MWFEFVVGPLPCSERFFSWYSGFLLRWTTLWICYLPIIIYYWYYLVCSKPLISVFFGRGFIKYFVCFCFSSGLHKVSGWTRWGWGQVLANRENQDKCQMSSTEICYFRPYRFRKFASQLDFTFLFRSIVKRKTISVRFPGEGHICVMRIRPIRIYAYAYTHKRVYVYTHTRIQYTVNDLINVQSQINALYLIDAPLEVYSLYYTPLSNKCPLSNRPPSPTPPPRITSKIKKTLRKSRNLFSFLRVWPTMACEQHLVRCLVRSTDSALLSSWFFDSICQQHFSYCIYRL